MQDSCEFTGVFLVGAMTTFHHLQFDAFWHELLELSGVIDGDECIVFPVHDKNRYVFGRSDIGEDSGCDIPARSPIERHGAREVEEPGGHAGAEARLHVGVDDVIRNRPARSGGREAFLPEVPPVDQPPQQQPQDRGQQKREEQHPDGGQHANDVRELARDGYDCGRYQNKSAYIIITIISCTDGGFQRYQRAHTVPHQDVLRSISDERARERPAHEGRGVLRESPERRALRPPEPRRVEGDNVAQAADVRHAKLVAQQARAEPVHTEETGGPFSFLGFPVIRVIRILFLPSLVVDGQPGDGEKPRIAVDGRFRYVDCPTEQWSGLIGERHYRR